MSYTYYCLGLAAHSVNLASLLDDSLVAAYAIGSLDRLAAIRLPRCRKEVEDAIAALWRERCDRLQAERDNYHGLLDAAEEARKNPPIVVDGNVLTQMKKDYIEVFGADNYGMLRQHIDAHTRRGDGSLDADLATLILFTAMKYHVTNKTK